MSQRVLFSIWSFLRLFFESLLSGRLFFLAACCLAFCCISSLLSSPIVFLSTFSALSMVLRRRGERTAHRSTLRTTGPSTAPRSTSGRTLPGGRTASRGATLGSTSGTLLGHGDIWSNCTSSGYGHGEKNGFLSTSFGSSWTLFGHRTVLGGAGECVLNQLAPK